MLFMTSLYDVAEQADLCWLVVPDRIPASLSWWLVRADTGGRSLKWECWCTSNEISHMLSVHHWGGRMVCWKKTLFSLHPDSALWSTFLSLHLSFHLHLKCVSQLLARHSDASREYVQFRMSSAKPHWLYVIMGCHLWIHCLEQIPHLKVWMVSEFRHNCNVACALCSHGHHHFYSKLLFWR